MFTEDYLLRMINLAIAALMNAIGLRKAGKGAEARQAIEQAIQQLTALSPSLIDQMDDASILAMLTNNGQLDLGRLAVLGDLYEEQGNISSRLEQPAQASFAYGRALRLTLEVALAEDGSPAPENMVRVGALLQKLKLNELPVDTQLALSDYYRRLLDVDDQTLAAGSFTRKQIEQALDQLQELIDHPANTIGD